jgi:hypothetical protein
MKGTVQAALRERINNDSEKVTLQKEKKAQESRE